MKKIIRRSFAIFIIAYGSILLINNWAVYKEIIFDLYDHVVRSDFDRAIEYDNLDIKNNPNNSWNYIARGHTYKTYKMYKRSLSDYLKAYSLDNSFPIILKDISNLYLAIGDTVKAHEYIDMLIKKVRDPNKVMYDLAIIYDCEWKNRKAIETYTKYIEHNSHKKTKSKYIFSLKRRAIHNIIMREYNNARDDIETLLKENPNDKETNTIHNLLSNIDDLSRLSIREEFKLNIYEAIVEVNTVGSLNE